MGNSRMFGAGAVVLALAGCAGSEATTETTATVTETATATVTATAEATAAEQDPSELQEYAALRDVWLERDADDRELLCNYWMSDIPAALESLDEMGLGVSEDVLTLFLAESC